MNIHSQWNRRDQHVPEGNVAFGAPSSRMQRLELHTSQDDFFTGRMRVLHMGGVRLCRVSALAAEEGRPQQSCKALHDPFYKLVFQLRGAAAFRQRDRLTLLNPSSWTIYDTSKPYHFDMIEATEQLVIMLPKTRRISELDRQIRQIPDGAMEISSSARVLFQSARSAMRIGESFPEDVADALGSSILELARVAILERAGLRHQGNAREIFRMRVERHVNQRLADPQLSVASIASALGCSKRYLHKVFAESGATLSAYIWSGRLERCMRDLGDPLLADRSITEIAFNWGFVNSAHFSRSFREHFGISPRDHRQMQLRGGAVH